MRILVAHDVPRRRNGGMSRLIGFTHDRVSAAGHTVDLLCADDVPPPAVPALRRVTFPIAVWRHVAAAAAAGRPYDIVNVHEPSAAAVAARRDVSGPALVVTSHGVERRAWELALEERRLGREGPRWVSRMAYPLTRLWQASFGLRRADHIFCLSADDREYLATRYGIEPARVTRIFPGAADVYATAAAARSYAAASTLLFPATWRKNKGIEDLVPAFTTLARARPGVRLVVLGGGLPDSEILRAFPAEARPAISCVTAADDRAAAAVFARADVCVLPSLFEGTPVTLVEAMASGLPIVTTATCGMKDVVRDGENGRLVPIRDSSAIVAATADLLDHAVVRERLGRTAQAEARSMYTWDVVSRPIAGVYAQLFSRRRALERPA